MSRERESDVDLALLGRRIKQVQYRNHRTMEAALRPLDVSLVQWDALRAIDRLPGASGHVLAQATFQSDQAWGTLATRLVDRGLVQRSAGVGRRVAHHLTDAGRELLSAGAAVTERVLPELFAAIGDRDRAALLALLDLLTTDEVDLPPAPTPIS
jgi:DNA-binding MarR family transcriptional regulator